MNQYNLGFYSYLASFAAASAERIVPILTGVISARTVLDFGCGEGAWLQVWADAGASVLGVDGPYVDRRRLLIDPTNFRAADLAEPIDLGRRFDIVQSLEVAEHLPPGKAEQFVESLTRHSSVVLFSAAIPGQGGENHINEQPLAYWRRLFRNNGYVAVDFLRPLICNDPGIARWYRYNSILYIDKDALAALPERVQQRRVPDYTELTNYWPPSYRLRHAMIRRVPSILVNGLSRVNGILASRVASTQISRRADHG